jgi:hypothetical protein
MNMAQMGAGGLPGLISGGLGLLGSLFGGQEEPKPMRQPMGQLAPMNFQGGGMQRPNNMMQQVMARYLGGR